MNMSISLESEDLNAWYACLATQILKHSYPIQAERVEEERSVVVIIIKLKGLIWKEM